MLIIGFKNRLQPYKRLQNLLDNKYGPHFICNAYAYLIQDFCAYK